MSEKLMEGKVCPNHPKAQAVSRCTTCFKPLCKACILVKGDMDFCSDQCATNHFTTNASIGASLSRDAAAKRRARIRKLIFLLILLLAGFGGAYYWQTHMSSKDKNKAKSLWNKAKKTGKKAVKETKKLAD